MFRLTRHEQVLVAGVLGILLLGLGVGHWRKADTPAKEVGAALEARTDE